MSRNKRGKGRGGNAQQSKSARTSGGKSGKGKGSKPKEGSTTVVTKHDTKKKKKKEKKKDDDEVYGRAPAAKSELRFSPYAWAKLIFLRDIGDTEVSVFGLSRRNDLLYVEDVRLVEQEASGASFDFDDDGLNEYLFDMLKEGYQPVECMRIWVHTHPGGASPSGKDMTTFDMTTGEADWGIMCIVGNDGATSARLRIASGVSGNMYDVGLDVMVDWSGEFRGVTQEDAAKWKEKYEELVDTTPAWKGGTTYKYYKTGTSALGAKDGKDGPAADGKAIVAGSTPPMSEFEQYYHDAYGSGAYYGGGDRGAGSGGAGGGDPGSYGHGRTWADDCDKDMPRLGQDTTQPSENENEPTIVVPRRRPDPQMVHIVETNRHENVKTVWTDKYWFDYDINEVVPAAPGDEIESFNDICQNHPCGWGQVLWGVDEAGNPTCERLSIYDPAKEDFETLDTALEKARKMTVDVKKRALTARLGLLQLSAEETEVAMEKAQQQSMADKRATFLAKKAKDDADLEEAREKAKLEFVTGDSTVNNSRPAMSLAKGGPPQDGPAVTAAKAGKAEKKEEDNVGGKSTSGS